MDEINTIEQSQERKIIKQETKNRIHLAGLLIGSICMVFGLGEGGIGVMMGGLILASAGCCVNLNEMIRENKRISFLDIFTRDDKIKQGGKIKFI